MSIPDFCVVASDAAREAARSSAPDAPAGSWTATPLACYEDTGLFFMKIKQFLCSGGG
jgi:hypothetical protein